jgi:tetratricopeptide (TPR) repeat protein
MQTTVRYFCAMRNIFYFLVFSTILFSACDNEKKKPLTQDDQPIQQDTTRTASQLDFNTDSLNNYIFNNPNNANALVARAEVYIKNQNLKYAFADAQAAMQLDSLNPNVLLMWGDVNYLANKTRLSKTAWENCIKLDKTNIDCRLKLAELYNVVQEFAKSQKLVDEVIALDNTQAIAYYIKGINIRDMRGDTVAALPYFQKAIDLDNNYVSALDMMGVMLSAKKDPLALAYFNRILEINPNHYPTYYNMGMFYLKTEDWNNAVIAFTKCTQLKPSDVESLFNLGYIHLQLKVYNIARDYFSDALKVQPVNHRALYGRGYAYEMLGDVINAEKDYRLALSYNPQHEPSKIALQRVLRNNGAQ